MRVIVIDSSSSGAGDNSLALAFLSVLRCAQPLPPRRSPWAYHTAALFLMIGYAAGVVDVECRATRLGQVSRM